MNQQAWLQHCATKDQLAFFEDQGYLIVKDALEPELLGRLNEAVDRGAERERDQKELIEDKNRHPAMVSKFRTVVEDDTFLDLLDNPKTFPLLWEILGWNIQLYISHLILYPPEQKGGEVDKQGRPSKAAGYYSTAKDPTRPGEQQVVALSSDRTPCST